MKFNITFFVFFLLFISISCTNSRNEMVLVKVTEMGSAKISDSTLVDILQQELNENIRIEYTLYEDTAIKMLEDKEVDFAIIPNNTPMTGDDRNLRSVTPLLPRILVIMSYNVPGADNKNLKDLFEENDIIFEDMSHLDTLIFKTFFESVGTHFPEKLSYKIHDLKEQEWLDSSFVYVGLTHLHNPIMRDLVDHGAKFHPLDKIENLGKGSAVEGLKLVIPQFAPFIIPKSFYKGKPEEPVLTAAIPDILITSEDEDKYLVYSIVETITEKKPELLNKDHIYNLLDLNINDYVLSFPLHEGAKTFKNRNKPSIWTRYASVLWPFLSILAILAGAFASLKRHLNQRKKMRVELLYSDLLRLRKKALSGMDDEEKEKLLKQMHKIRTRAFDALMENKLNLNESFSIFLTLYDEIIKEIINTGNE